MVPPSSPSPPTLPDSVLAALRPLAGLADYGRAARPGPGVEEAVARLRRLHWVERRLFALLVARLPSTPEWEAKGAFALHQWWAAEHGEVLRLRVAEMRSPAPSMDAAPDPAIDAFLDELAASAGSAELLAGVYGVALPALAAAYRRHLDETNPLVDHPTVRALGAVAGEVEAAAAWGRPVVEALLSADETGNAVDGWMAHLEAWLDFAGGILGDEAGTVPVEPPPARAPVAPSPDFHPRRDRRFSGCYNFVFPPHTVYAAAEVDAQERNLALLCKRVLEMDVPEMMASFLSQRTGMPWAFYLDYSRQLWDEARHSMLGEVALERLGVDWRALPLNVGFALRLNLHAEPVERQLVLWAIEQGLMPGGTGKRYEYETARAAGDEFSAYLHDFDWADEVLHARIGRRWLLGPDGEGYDHAGAMEAGRAVHERTWACLDEYRDREPQREWWTDFVATVLGRPSTAQPRHLHEAPRVVAE